MTHDYASKVAAKYRMNRSPRGFIRRFVSAITGRFVTRTEAEANPATTFLATEAAPRVQWRRFGSELPVTVGATVDILVIREGEDEINSGFYSADDDEYFVAEDFHKPAPGDLWVYQSELMP